jgi:hypothetical protein
VSVRFQERSRWRPTGRRNLFVVKDRGKGTYEATRRKGFRGVREADKLDRASTNKKEGKMKSEKARMVVLLVVGLSLVAGSAFAAYPEKPITWVVTWPAGGRTDTVSRIFAPALEKILGQPVVVMNKPGAGGVIGARKSPWRNRMDIRSA